jgi:hypothetical protein
MIPEAVDDATLGVDDRSCERTTQPGRRIFAPSTEGGQQYVRGVVRGRSESGHGELLEEGAAVVEGSDEGGSEAGFVCDPCIRPVRFGRGTDYGLAAGVYGLRRASVPRGVEHPRHDGRIRRRAPRENDCQRAH